ncbi:hypothetical protein OS493_006364 [Desmophyllum pertusum]|uniref:Kazal-like domain-containing protein n=1 Tax=Desmophyllum pertusum TaxID=174260 RepID=A0A9X0A4R9_9CNID|nr:hypothetical protein OS493_006364 [Desmophyllum pertusum]
MNTLLVSTVFIVAFSAWQTSAMLHSGQGSITVLEDKEYECKPFPFDPELNSNDIRVHLTVKGSNYETAVPWIESVSGKGFTGCVATSGPIATSRTISLQWMAFKHSDIPSIAFAKILSIPLWTTGTKCVVVDTGSQFSLESYTPFIFLTVIHTSPTKYKHDATSVWAEDVTKNDFKACVRELKNFDGVHTGVEVEVLALTYGAIMPSGWSIPYNKKVLFNNGYSPSANTGYSFCKDVSFAYPYFKTPIVLTTATHDETNIAADNNAITEWTQSVSKSGFRICLKDIQRYDYPNHDPITVNYLAIGSIDPCQGVTCNYYAECESSSPTNYACKCQACTGSESGPLCDDNGVTHKSRCEYELAVCNAKSSLGIKHNGGCKPFILERGRVALRLNATDVQCKTVSFKQGAFESSKGVYVQTSINYFNYTGNFTHDAAVTWVENVATSTFKVCALKAGRAERWTPDHGLTFVDFVAFQESPVGALSGRIQMPSKWWDGTTCEKVSFYTTTFSTVPYVLLTAEHNVLGQKHDAATVWVENPKKDGFTACLREMQNFDGLHENIIVNWIAFKSLPSKLLARQKFIDFPNSDLPQAGYHNAYCETVPFGKTYASTPTIIVSASHNSGTGAEGNMIPEYNTIASWIEHITNTDYRVCIKEIHKPNGYDPVKVSALMIGT